MLSVLTFLFWTWVAIVGGCLALWAAYKIAIAAFRIIGVLIAPLANRFTAWYDPKFLRWHDKHH